MSETPTMKAARYRLNELEVMYPRKESRDPNSPTVMESDREYLARHPHIAEEWRRLWAVAKGEIAA